MGATSTREKPTEIMESVLADWEAAILISNGCFGEIKPTGDWLGDWKVDYV